MEETLPRMGAGGGGLGMLQAHCIYRAPYFYRHIISIAGYQTLDSGGWGPLHHSKSSVLHQPGDLTLCPSADPG